MSEDESKNVAENHNTQPVLLTPTVIDRLTRAREHLDVSPGADYPEIIEELIATHPIDLSEWPENESD